MWQVSWAGLRPAILPAMFAGLVQPERTMKTSSQLLKGCYIIETGPNGVFFHVYYNILYIFYIDVYRVYYNDRMAQLDYLEASLMSKVVDR